VEFELYRILPEMVILITAGIALLLGLSRHDFVRRLTQVMCAAGLLVSLYFSLGMVMSPETAAWCSEWFPDLSRFGSGVSPVGLYVSVLASAIGFLSILAAWDMPARNEPASTDRNYRGEFYAMMMFSIAGVSMIGKVNDLVLLFIVLELVSIPTYILVTTGRGQIIAQEAGVKYFFLGALSAAIYLFGFSYLYGYAGSTRFSWISARFAMDMHGVGNTVPLIAIVGLLMVIIGVAYKIAAVPLHFYTPDVYQGAATPVTAFLAFAPKAAGFVAIITMLDLTGWNFANNMAGPLGSALLGALIVMSVLTMTIGNVLALLQRNVKRMMAYSSIAHSGYMLVGLVAGRAFGIGSYDPSKDGVSATLFYLGAYSIMNLGAFAVLIYMQGKADAGEEIDDLAGISKQHPVAAFAMMICMFSLIGMPFTIGFYAKLYIVQSALATGHTTLAIVVMVNAAIAAAYYLRVIAAMYLRDAWNPFSVRRTLAPRVAAFVCTAAVILFGFVPGPLLRMSNYPAQLAVRPVPTQVQLGSAAH
jgi:NADH-quinone oxidoreductase subunit N